jgi:NAD dependent epimerase/dehydratase family enzyme
VHHEHRRTRGRQHFSWIHVEDVHRSIRFLEESTLDGPVNLASPNPSDNTELSRLLRAAVGRRIGVPAPRFVLEPATLLLRTESELLLKSRWVVPARLEDAGFTFAHPHLTEALRTLA